MAGLKQSSRTADTAVDNTLSIKALIDTIRVGILFFNENCEVVLTNHAAQLIIHSRDWLWLADRRLRTGDHKNTDIEQRIHNAIEQRAQPTDSPLVLTGEQREDTLLLDFAPLNTEDSYTLAVCLIIDPQQRHSPDVSSLKQMYALTDAEANITTLIAGGLDYKEIALQRHVSIATVRTYTKSIFKKLGVASRASLVYKIHSTIMPLRMLK